MLIYFLWKVATYIGVHMSPDETIRIAEINDTSFERAACFHWDQAKKTKWPTQKTSFPADSSWYFFMKILCIAPLVSGIDWCGGHWCGSTFIVVRLSDTSSKTAKNAFLGCFWAYVGQSQDHISWATPMPFVSINSTNPKTNAWNFHD